MTTIKCQRLQPKGRLGERLTEAGVRIFAVHREDVEALGLSSVVAFCDNRNSSIFLIEEDCDAMSQSAVEFVVYHELHHIVCGGSDEKTADEYACAVCGRTAYHMALEETERLRAMLRAQRGTTMPSDDGIYEFRKSVV